MRSKELRAARAKLIEEWRALLAADNPSAEIIAQADAMEKKANELKEQIDRLERADVEFAATMEAQRTAGVRLGSGPAPDSVDPAHAALENSTFMAWVRGGTDRLNAEQRDLYGRRFQAALGEGIDTAGGYAVPQGFYTRLIDALLAYGGMLEAGFVFETATGNDIPIPTDNDTANEGAILGENTTVTQQDITFGTVVLHAYTYTSKLILISNQLLQDSAFPLEPWLADRLAIRIARVLNRHLTTGDGASKPTGVLTAATLGATAAVSPGVTYDDLVNLEHSVDPAYRNANARFMFADAVLKSLKLLKDGMGRPLWLPGLAVKEPDTINGFPYTINQSMPAATTGLKSVAFGDFKNYFIRRVAGTQMRRLTERYADNNQVGFVAFQRWDGNLVDAGTHPIKYLLQP
jgi:HK97 family phage major capsid protein